jgi:hypothetical protein
LNPLTHASSRATADRHTVEPSLAALDVYAGRGASPATGLGPLGFTDDGAIRKERVVLG